MSGRSGPRRGRHRSVYKTSTKTNSKTINLPKGTYRAVVDGRCGYLGVTSNEVKLKR